MKSRTLSVESTASPARVYAYAVDPENLPHWAPGLCRSVAQFDGRWIVESPTGETLDFAFVEANRFGVLDHTVLLPSGESMLNPMRVVANGEGSEILFTVFQRPGMSDADFERDVGLVQADLEKLARAVAS
jgi:hypothetical protein